MAKDDARDDTGADDTRAPNTVELEIPEAVFDAKAAVEVLRAFIADGSLHVSINSGAFEDRAEDWGRLLGQIAHHVAKAAHLQGHMTSSQALQAMRRGFEATVPQHQQTLSGSIRGRVSH